MSPKSGAIAALLLLALPCRGQDSRDPMAGGIFQSQVGRYDGRPYARVHGTDGLLLRSTYFDWKNELWREQGFSFGGYLSANVQAGSARGGTHGVGEGVFLATWEPLRRATQTGRFILGVAHDQTLGGLTTRDFSTRQELVETANDLDTDPDPTFTTLGLLL